MLSPHCMNVLAHGVTSVSSPLQLSTDYQVSSGRVLAHCEVCSAEVNLSNLQRLMVDSYTKVRYWLVCFCIAWPTVYGQ